MHSAIRRLIQARAAVPIHLSPPTGIARLLLVATLAVFMHSPNSVNAQEANEYEVKAAFLYNFAKFVDWPVGASEPGAPLVIGVLGRDPFQGAIDRAIEGKMINGRRLTIRRFPSIEAYQYCHILFVSSSERDRLPRIIAAIGNSSVLTVSDLDRFAHLGGIINFVTIENRIRFEINQGAAERARLKISSKLLSLARVVGT
jgi:hypothetical protein